MTEQARVKGMLQQTRTRILSGSVFLQHLLGVVDVLGHRVLLGHALATGPRVVLGLPLHVEHSGSIRVHVADRGLKKLIWFV